MPNYQLEILLMSGGCISDSKYRANCVHKTAVIDCGEGPYMTDMKGKFFECNGQDYFVPFDSYLTPDEFKFRVIKFPGHKEDSVAFYFELEKVMFVGDFVFKDSIGRIDLKGASPYDMKKSIQKLLEYPKDVTLFPGHMGKTTIGEEVESLNNFMSII